MTNHTSISPHTSTALPAADKIPVQEKSENEPTIEALHEMGLQFKLSIGAVDDPLENEAESMADTIMRMPEQNFIQRKCSHCEEEEKVQRKPITSFIQRKESSAHTVASDKISSQINSSKGGGNYIDSGTQSFMQSRFGSDFSNVKIHIDEDAKQMNRELSAKAFTIGNDIYFNEGQYNPGSDSGKHLLAHELTHTVQQGNQSTVQKKFIQRTEEEDRAVLQETPPTPVTTVGMSLDEQVKNQLEYLALSESYRDRLSNAVMAPLEGRERADAISFLNRLRSLTSIQAIQLVDDDKFFTRIRKWFRGKPLWSVFSILYFNNHMDEPYLRLNYAVMNSDARLLTDMLSIVIPQHPTDRYFNMLREVSLTIFNGDRLLPEILRLIDHRNDSGISRQLSGNVNESHYEKNAAGNFALSNPSSAFSADAYFSNNELRVIVRIRFVDASDTVNCDTASNPLCQPFYFLGSNAHYYDEWRGYITDVWNNKFNATNGTNTYAITFVPLFLSGNDTSAVNVRVISTSGQRCFSGDTWARSYSSCWQLGAVNKNTVAHEFGHLIGASDEYNLPGSIKEITDAGITGLSAEDLSLTTVEGITGTAAPVSSSGQGYTQNSLMASTNNDVYARHLTRLIRSLNDSRAAGTAVFRVVKRN